MNVREYKESDFQRWKEMRMELWPETEEVNHEEEMKMISSGQTFDSELGWSIYVVEDNQQLIGFIESSLREKMEGCESTPVGYIEGWYVDQNYRKMGIGKLLTNAAEDWARSKRCSFMASDVEPDNDLSLLAHQHLGYQTICQNEAGYILLKSL